jgi:hypothetical protein
MHGSRLGARSASNASGGRKGQMKRTCIEPHRVTSVIDFWYDLFDYSL